jgi:hypothetical protein
MVRLHDHVRAQRCRGWARDKANIGQIGRSNSCEQQACLQTASHVDAAIDHRHVQARVMDADAIPRRVVDKGLAKRGGPLIKVKIRSVKGKLLRHGRRLDDQRT